MKGKTIITISRQFGSGGYDVGEKLSKQLEIPMYDKELITLAAKESGYSEKLFEEMDEKPTNSFLYSLAMGSYVIGNSLTGALEMPLNDKLFVVQSNVMQRLAGEGSCIFIGRCADYILREEHDCVNVYIHADLQKRIASVAKKFNISEAKAKDLIQKTDKKRASYYNYFSNTHWGRAENYHLSIDTGVIGIDNAVSLIEAYIKMKHHL